MKQMKQHEQSLSLREALEIKLWCGAWKVVVPGGRVFSLLQVRF